jgi:hypothetical protein
MTKNNILGIKHNEKPHLHCCSNPKTYMDKDKFMHFQSQPVNLLLLGFLTGSTEPTHKQESTGRFKMFLMKSFNISSISTKGKRNISSHYKVGRVCCVINDYTT